MKAGAAFGNYIKVADLNGKRVAVTISNVDIEEIGGEKKLVAEFQGKDKKFVINRTNADTITEILGTDETDDWAGQTIVLFPSKTSFQGKRVDCIRIDAYRKPTASPARPVQPEPSEDLGPITDDDVPF